MVIIIGEFKLLLTLYKVMVKENMENHQIRKINYCDINGNKSGEVSDEYLFIIGCYYFKYGSSIIASNWNNCFNS